MLPAEAIMAYTHDSDRISRLGRTGLGVVLLAGISCALASGCSKHSAHSPVYPVRGQVLLNGKPLADAIVSFHSQSGAPEEVFPAAHTDTEGRFALTSFEEGDGAPEGTYSISLVCFKTPAARGNGGRATNVLPYYYASPDSSRLAATVVPGTNDLPPLQLKNR